MKKSTIDSLMTFEQNAAKEITKIIIFARDEELGMVPVRANGSDADVRQSVYASLDLLRHGIYEHNMTQPGLHFYKPEGIQNAFSQHGVAAVSVNFEPNNGFRLVPMIKDHPYGWASVNIMNRIYTLGKPQNAEAFARKHNYIDALLLGYGLEIFVPAWLYRVNGAEQLIPWADAMVAQWQETDDKKARKDRDERVNRSIDNDSLYAPIAKAKANNGGTITMADIPNVNGETNIPMVDGSAVALANLPMGKYLVYNKSRVVRTLPWDGSVDSLAIVGQVVKRGWTLKTK